MASVNTSGFSSVGSMFRQRNSHSRNLVRVSCSSTSSSSSTTVDPYQTLRIKHGASEYEVKKAFRKLALKYHPSVCKGRDSRMQFHELIEAYDVAMDYFRGIPLPVETYEEGVDEPMKQMEDPEWEMWKEWKGWEGAWIQDYSSRIKSYKN